MADKVDKFKEIKKTAEDLEKLIMGTDAASSIQASMGDDILPKLKAIRPLDYEKVKSDADEKASDIIESVIKMYLPPEFVLSQDYVFQKMEVDKMTVSNLIFQMKTAEHAIKKLLEEIDNGFTQARNFEVLASLQKSKMEIVKHLSAFMVIMENNYKNLKFDYFTKVAEKELGPPMTSDIKQLEEGKTLESPESTKFRGTKDLMAKIQTYMKQAKDNGSDRSAGYEDIAPEPTTEQPQ